MNERAAGGTTQVPNWEHFDHDADIGVRGIGATLNEAFEHAALALTAVVTDLARVEAREKVAISCAAPSDDILLYDWLNALIYEMVTRRMVFARFHVEVRDGHLNATAWGEPVDFARHAPAVEIKGATFTELRVAQRADGAWIAQCIVDV